MNSNSPISREVTNSPRQITTELLKKKNSSQMATSMELLQQGEHFQMIDPPSLPLKPDFPNRLKFCGIGLGIGIALGGALAGGTEFLDDRLYRRESTQGPTAHDRDLGDPADHQSVRGKKAREEALDGLGNGRYCVCDCARRISHKLLARVVW